MPGCPVVRGARRGFTLLELTLVLAILAVAALVVGPSLVRSSTLGERREVRNDVTQLLRDARLDATRSGQPVEVRWVPSERRLSSTSERARPVTLPARWTVTPDGAPLGAPDPAAAQGPIAPSTLVVFSPSGLASRSAWRVRGPSGEVRVRTDAIDGLRVE